MPSSRIPGHLTEPRVRGRFTQGLDLSRAGQSRLSGRGPRSRGTGLTVLELAPHQYERIRSYVGVKQCAVPIIYFAAVEHQPIGHRGKGLASLTRGGRTGRHEDAHPVFPWILQKHGVRKVAQPLRGN
jgi:hypothetical protein